jgi:SPP1 gp7 family putative phage head morphogenesis protein
VERAFGLELAKMQAALGRAFVAELKRLPAGLFADAPTDPYQAAAERAWAKQAKRLDPKKVKALAERMAKRAGLSQKAAFGALKARTIAVNSKEIASTEALKVTTAQFVAETEEWIAKLNSESMQSFANRAAEGVRAGLSLDEVVASVGEVVETRKNHARFVARNQIQNYNAISGKVRAENLGITRAIWRTSGDERVRPSHADRDGKEFNLDEGLESELDDLSLIPGVDFNCRCVAEYVLPE